MSEDKGSARPRQVTMGVVMAVISSLLLVLGLFDTLERLRTPATREAVDEFLAGTPGSSLSLETSQVVELMRALAFVSGALAAMGLVFAVFVWQRHRGARIGFTVVAVLLLLTVPVAGLMPVFLAVSAFLLWSQPARDWYAGRTPASVAVGHGRPVSLRSDVEHGSGGSHRATPGEPPVAPPVAGPDAPEGSQPPPYPQQFGQSSPQPQPQPQPQPYGPPPDPWAPHRAQDEQRRPDLDRQQHSAHDKRPTPVTVAALLTWIGGGLTALAMVAFLVVLAVDGDAFVDEFNRAAQQSDLTLTRDQVWVFGLVIGLTLLAWSLISVVLAIFAFRRSNGARYALAISAVMAALFSLLSIMSIVSVLTLLLAVATVILLFAGSASRWFARRSGTPDHPAYPPGYPPHYPYAGYPHPDQQAQQAQQAQQQGQQPPQPEQQPDTEQGSRRNQPW